MEYKIKFNVQTIVGIVIAALMIGIMLPLSLNGILAYDSGNTTINTLINTVLPLVAVVSLVLLFIPRADSE